jgi:hypothetical protein
MSILKQLAIHRMALTGGIPNEIAHEILSFCFYDIKTAICRANHKYNMMIIRDNFEKACDSRAIYLRDNIEWVDTEHWSICLSRFDHPEDNEIQLQAISCGFCGNYKVCTTHEPDINVWDIDDIDIDQRYLEEIPIRLRCNCNI